MKTSIDSNNHQSTRRRGLAALILLAAAFSLTLSATAAAARTTKSSAVAQSTLFLTQNGHIVAQDPAPSGANDLHYVWNQTRCRGSLAYPFVYVYFTENGRIIGKALAPCKVDDFEFVWDPATGLITKATWTIGGKPFAAIPVPSGANDVHVFLTGKTHLLKAYWTLNGKPILGIDIPGYVNDMHWFGYPVPVGTSGAPSFLYFTLNGKIVGMVQAPPAANDLHYIWTSGGCRNGLDYPPVKLVFTVNGQIIGKPIAAICKANDFEMTWNPNGCVTSASWTDNGRVIGNIAVPVTACVNDAHLYLGGHLRLLYAWWTFNGQPIMPVIKIPGVVNDMHWYGYPTTAPGVVRGLPANFER